MDRDVLIAYFSRAGMNYVGGAITHLSVGNTEKAAGMVAELTKGSLFRIEPVLKYSEEYQPCTEEAQRELRANARPALVSLPEGPVRYDTVILCYPNWWGTMPMPVWTFLEALDSGGKVILPLCTHEGSGMGRSAKDILTLCPRAKILRGLALRGGQVGGSKQMIESWLRDAKTLP